MRRRCRRAALATALFLSVSWWLVGCTSTVTRPAGPLDDPTTVFLVFDDRHRGLVLPRPERGFVGYGFGDWSWYAEARDAWYQLFPAVLWPTRGTLGRRSSAAPDVVALRTRWWWMRLEPIDVERSRVEALLQKLDAEFVARVVEMHRNEQYGMDFVPSDDGFWCLYNCRDAVAEWLEELGCSVSWVPIRVDLEIDGG